MLTQRMLKEIIQKKNGGLSPTKIPFAQIKDCFIEILQIVEKEDGYLNNIISKLRFGIGE